MSTRRKVLILLGGIASSGSAWALQAERTYRIGWLSSSASRSESYNVAFVQRLAELGFVEGRNLLIEYRSADGKLEKLPALAAELARKNCDVLLAPGTEANLIAQQQATTITPIVFVANDYDPVETGHIASLAHPGGR